MAEESRKCHVSYPNRFIPGQMASVSDLLITNHNHSSYIAAAVAPPSWSEIVSLSFPNSEMFLFQHRWRTSELP